MDNFAQQMIDGIDKTTEEGFAEALTIAISHLKDKDGKLLGIRLGNNVFESIDFATQIAKMMLNKEKNT